MTIPDFCQSLQTPVKELSIPTTPVNNDKNDTNNKNKTDESNNILTQIKDTFERTNKENKISFINTKLACGKKLTESEMSYLKCTKPELYQKAIEAENERYLFRTRLDGCHSKKEAKNEHFNSVMRYVSSGLSSKSVASSFNDASRNLNICNDEYNNYSRSGMPSKKY